MDRHYRTTVLLLVVLLAGCATIPAAPTETSSPGSAATGEHTEYEVTVTEVVDGDTMTVAYRNGSTETIRLLGVDTPEVHVENDPAEFDGIPDTDRGREWLRDWGHKASEYARSEIAGEQVRIVVDSQADRRGSYGRLLVYVHHDSELLNRQLLVQGYARMYDSTFSRRDEFRRLEQTAQANDVGLWGFSGSTTPTLSGGQSDSLAVVQIHEDAAGNDHENLNDEYMVFENRADTRLDLTDWQVSDEAGNRYVFPDGFTLAAGQQVTLYTGSGSDTETELYWGSDSAVWNNGGDTIRVEDERGAVVLEVTY
jgi:micrococcal nuclease